MSQLGSRLGFHTHGAMFYTIARKSSKENVNRARLCPTFESYANPFLCISSCPGHVKFWHKTPWRFIVVLCVLMLDLLFITTRLTLLPFFHSQKCLSFVICSSNFNWAFNLSIFPLITQRDGLLTLHLYQMPCAVACYIEKSSYIVQKWSWVLWLTSAPNIETPASLFLFLYHASAFRWINVCKWDGQQQFPSIKHW